MNHAPFLTATALVARRRALPLQHHRLHRLHHLQWVDTAEKAQRSLLRGVRLLGLSIASHMLHRCVCCVFLNYLRHVSLVQNLFTVVATGSDMPLHV